MFDIEFTRHHFAAICILTAIFCFESIFPFRVYLSRLKHYGRNAVFAVCNGLITGLSSSLMSVCAFMVIDKNSLGLLNQWELSTTLSGLLAFLIFDAWIYLWHRLNHIVPFFWRFHQVHHNDLEMDMSTALRFHPGEILMASALNVIIFMLAGISIEQIIFYKAVFHINVLVHHSNINMSEQWDKALRLFIVTPNVHRVHHSIKRVETDSNYSSVLTLWDRIFGTYRESDPDKIVFGLETDRSEEAQKVPYLLTLPFKHVPLKEVSARQAKTMIEKGPVTIIDTRQPQDYAASHIDGAVSISATNIDDIVGTLDKSKPIICYCYKGISSKSICQNFVKEGFTNVYNLKGGYDEWQNK